MNSENSKQEKMLNTNKIKLVGVGPGDPDFVTLRVAREIEAADVVAGFATVLNVVDQCIKGQRIVLTYRNQEEQLAQVARMHADGKRCVVCCYGDLNFSAQELIARVERHCGPTERIPGISSVQVASARSALAMEETLFFTLHARDGIEAAQQEIIAAAASGKRNLIMLPLPWSFMPPQIAQMLLDGGIEKNRPITVHQRLTLPDESSVHTTLAQLAAWPGEFSDLSIVVLPRSSADQKASNP
ncbi:MAG TPA: precorrin-6y C5,15-methyltransferase (decarboxylating) subunit CbiE [Ktedonobacteraceae bacterium]|nr:precorrin-6y C5,15-methyltransferase (decarboxylating) subunit CbiE [Ktedonobacteraceae bacterium]